MVYTWLSPGEQNVGISVVIGEGSIEGRDDTFDFSGYAVKVERSTKQSGNRIFGPKTHKCLAHQVYSITIIPALLKDPKKTLFKYSQVTSTRLKHWPRVSKRSKSSNVQCHPKIYMSLDEKTHRKNSWYRQLLLLALTT